MSDVKTRFHLADGALTVERVQDVEAIIERNKQLQSLEQRSDWGRHVACIPNVIIERWLNEEWARGNTQLRMLSDEFDRLVQKKLRDPEWRFLRTD
jgi:hypothetical protein